MTEKRRIYTVSELTSELKSILEDTYPIVWIIGEISNFAKPASGHYYFNLKDARTQISAVMFRNLNVRLKFQPEDGVQVMALGRISIYEPRGTYQLIIEHLEPSGLGALQLVFEKLKEKLEAEGLFSPDSKRPIPFLPYKITIITSPTGAVIHDILKIIERRFHRLCIQVFPVAVQGDTAEEQIVNAFKWLNKKMESDVVILARGGGSLEDLQAFNSESVARAIFDSKIPVISAVGHETDFTIADFVADLRAPTPSAAAELVVPLWSDLTSLITGLQNRLQTHMQYRLNHGRLQIHSLERQLKDPQRKIDELRLRLDDLISRAGRAIKEALRAHRYGIQILMGRMAAKSPLFRVQSSAASLDTISIKLLNTIYNEITSKQSKVNLITEKLIALSPMAILKRGYSITRTLPGLNLITHPASVEINRLVEVRVYKGKLTCRVKGKQADGTEENI